MESFEYTEFDVQGDRALLDDLVRNEKELQTENIDSGDGVTGPPEVDCTDSCEPLENTVDIDVQPDPGGGQPDLEQLEDEEGQEDEISFLDIDLEALTEYTGFRRSERENAGLPAYRYGQEQVQLVLNTLAVDISISSSYTYAVTRNDSEEWLNAMRIELSALHKLNTWTLNKSATWKKNNKNNQD